jgi:uncharacterized protein (TIGR02147 family)
MVSIFTCSNPAEFLKAVFEEKRAKNRGYSLRRFSSTLGVPASSLSFVFSGKRNFSAPTLATIGRKLGLANVEIEKLLSLQGVKSSKEILLHDQVERQKRTTQKSKFNSETLTQISGWYSLVALEALTLPKFRRDPDLIAETLGISTSRMKRMIDALIKVGMVVRDEHGVLKKAGPHVLVTSDAPSASLRAYHKQMLGKAAEAIQAETTSERYLGSEIFPFDKGTIPEAKKIIDRCLDDLIALSGRCKSPNTLYQAGIQLFEILPTRKKTHAIL